MSWTWPLIISLLSCWSCLFVCFDTCLWFWKHLCSIFCFNYVSLILQNCKCQSWSCNDYGLVSIKGVNATEPVGLYWVAALIIIMMKSSPLLCLHQQWLQRHLVRESSEFMWMPFTTDNNMLVCLEHWIGSVFTSTFCCLVGGGGWTELTFWLQGGEEMLLRGTSGRTQRKAEMTAVSVDGSSITSGKGAD